MSEQHRLRALHVRVAGEHCVRVRFCEVEQRRLRRAQALRDAVNLVAQPQSQRRRHLIVAASARVEPAPRVAYEFDEARLDERVNVLRRLVVEELLAALRGPRDERTQPVGNLRGLFVADDARRAKALAVREAAAHVRLEQPPVEAERAVEAREARVGLTAEAPAPKIFRLTHRFSSPTTFYRDPPEANV